MKRKKQLKIPSTKKLNLKNILLVLLTLVLVLEVSVTWYANATLNDKMRPSNIELTQIVDASCNDCFNLSPLIGAIKTYNVKIMSDKTLSLDSPEAKQMIIKYGIKRLPSLIISGEINRDEQLKSLFNNLGLTAIDSAVHFDASPPYVDVATGEVAGRVSMVSIYDNSCGTCYNVTVHKRILLGYGIVPQQESTYDVNSVDGKNLIEKYNITKVPTIILSPETFLYSSLVSIWKQIGTVEKDGWFVFRATEQMGTYKDISQNKTINATS